MIKSAGFLIAAPQSGSGKTTVSLAIMAGLAKRGIAVAPFKCGPDFIDPGYHNIVTGRHSVNLDPWMCSEEFVRETFQTALAGQAIAIIEGAMGLFDGIGPSVKGSSAQIAAITGAPVVLIINARGMAASAAAMVKGFADFDPQVKIAGVIFNNVGSDAHAALLKDSLAVHCPEVVCFGCVPRDESLIIPSRHLGLVTAEDNPLSDEFIQKLTDLSECCLDLDGLAALEIDFYTPEHNTLAAAKTLLSCDEPPVRIAVARDSAFCFIYADNLRLLEEAGAELVFFSPLHDSTLPPDAHGIYLPGGYPELYATELAENISMKNSIKNAVNTDMPVYAECGGFVYLTEGIDASENQVAADFVGIFQTRCRMLARRRALGYRQIDLTENVIIGSKGIEARGHEFHYSDIVAMPENIELCYRVSRQGVVLAAEGFKVRNCLASYIHLHFGSDSEIARTFVMSCRAHN